MIGDQSIPIPGFCRYNIIVLQCWLFVEAVLVFLDISSPPARGHGSGTAVMWRGHPHPSYFLSLLHLFAHHPLCAAALPTSPYDSVLHLVFPAIKQLAKIPNNAFKVLSRFYISKRSSEQKTCCVMHAWDVWFDQIFRGWREGSCTKQAKAEWELDYGCEDAKRGLNPLYVSILESNVLCLILMWWLLGKSTTSPTLPHPFSLHPTTHACL